MLRYAAMAVGAALLVALVFVFLPTHSGPRPEPRILASGEPQAPTSFTIHDAPPPPAAQAPPAPTPPAADLDAVMQRLRNAAATPATPSTTPSPIPVPVPATPAPDATAASQPPATPDPTAPPPPAPAAKWASVTGGGTRWRMVRSGNGYTVSIDLGGGHVADVHVLPAFANLDPAAVNVRVDYLRDTILQNFSSQSGSYSFARDGSVSIDH